jgi:hypothetical protein
MATAARRNPPQKKPQPSQRKLAVYWFRLGEVLVIADDPIQLGPKPILFLIEAAGEVWVNPGMMEVCEGDLERVTSASRAFDEDRLITAMIIAGKAYKPVLGSAADATARLQYVARKGSKVFQPKNFDRDDWLILKRWPHWRAKSIDWQDRVADFEDQSGQKKRCARLEIVPRR